MNLEQAVQQALVQNPSMDVQSIIIDDQKVWIKKARATQSSKLHKFYYFLFRLEILLPVKEKTEIEALDFEVNKIKHFKLLGINTPDILLETKEYFVLKDAGKMVNSYIRKRDITKERMYYYIDKVIDVLAQIHNSNLYHGGAQFRNFTYLDGKVYVIDLEDSFEDQVDLKTLQFRDFFLMLLSLTKTRATSFDLDFTYAIHKYINETNNIEFKQRLQNMANKISWIIAISEWKIMQKIMGRDVKGFFRLMREIQEL